MTEIQTKLLKMFLWYHDFCVEHNLTYYAICGTILGAVRHSGFIPWDDDVDVGMPRKDYEQFIFLMNQKSKQRYILEYPGENKDHIYPFSKLYDGTTTLIEDTRFKISRGLYIDIFPIDDAGNTYKESLRNVRKIWFLLDIHFLLSSSVRKGRKLYKNFLILFFRYILDPFLSVNKLINEIDKMGKNMAFEDAPFVVSTVGAWREKELMKREVFGKPKLYHFEGFRIYGPNDYLTYLTQVYGNYMELPPRDKRKSHHSILRLELTESYLDM